MIFLPDIFFDNVQIVDTLLIVCCFVYHIVFYCGFMNL